MKHLPSSVGVAAELSLLRDLPPFKKQLVVT
jgi:hypothetical protein